MYNYDNTSINHGCTEKYAINKKKLLTEYLTFCFIQITLMMIQIQQKLNARFRKFVARVLELHTYKGTNLYKYSNGFIFKLMTSLFWNMSTELKHCLENKILDEYKYVVFYILDWFFWIKNEKKYLTNILQISKLNLNIAANFSL